MEADDARWHHLKEADGIYTLLGVCISKIPSRCPVFVFNIKTSDTFLTFDQPHKMPDSKSFYD